MSKRYKLIFANEFLRKINKFDRQSQTRILRELRSLEENPYIGKRLLGRLDGLLSLRIGDYRIIYQMMGNRVIIRTVGHRKTIYER